MRRAIAADQLELRRDIAQPIEQRRQLRRRRTRRRQVGQLLHDGSAPPAAVQALRCARTARPPWQFDTALGERKLCAQLGVATLATLLAGRSA
jgi:hypothetical protein